VPPDIAAKELYPKQRRSPGYFARNDFYVSGGQLIQRAGPKSSLGYVKFDIPDAFDVYLHDTPARTLFARDKRWLSHGCMRIENPRDLAAALLGPQGWNRTTVDAAIAAGATRTVRLKTPVPVFVVYRTVVADAAGHASFRSDVYGWDAELEAALAARQP
jgi:murein L,D-transpeptidase YcbB/YkuD